MVLKLRAASVDSNTLSGKRTFEPDALGALLVRAGFIDVDEAELMTARPQLHL